MDERKMAMVLGDETRLKILKIIYEKGEVRGADLPQMLGKHRSTISRHLSVLLKYSLISRRLVNGDYYYTLTDDGKNIVGALIKTGFKPVVEVPVKSISIRSLFLGRSVFDLFALAVAAVLGVVGVAGLFTQAKVHAISRVVWLVLWLIAAFVAFKIMKKIKSLVEPY
ncbi:MAG: hypothetical protein DRN04_02295 [Thermoprotei archaeon]|nr:MAG: hypothetical protein DRN04_02295 [Thermoprotei archaeon]